MPTSLTQGVANLELRISSVSAVPAVISSVILLTIQEPRGRNFRRMFNLPVNLFLLNDLAAILLPSALLR
jgi:hypothetical protein